MSGDGLSVEIAVIREALDPLICSTCHGTGEAVGNSARHGFMATDCSDCGGSGGEFFDIEDAVYRGSTTRSPEVDARTLVATLRHVYRCAYSPDSQPEEGACTPTTTTSASAATTGISTKVSGDTATAEDARGDVASSDSTSASSPRGSWSADRTFSPAKRGEA